MDYRSEATSVEGFVQQLVSNYLASGYWFYVTGSVPVRKDPRTVDRKLVERYGIALSRPSRSRRKAAGLANLHLIRYMVTSSSWSRPTESTPSFRMSLRPSVTSARCLFSFTGIRLR